ncbi:hypothetical protein E2C01_068464 [Portunus trituberculatus]|uniref:Uncharacterized protein n=1 Tax=Portunus trituberculatus TaxID=210409 RepID=A0A5B7HWJ3_PORTR|nr:hypothetical protein [Portunus trituberculatus]
MTLSHVGESREMTPTDSPHLSLPPSPVHTHVFAATRVFN